jgi:hypothetical protein
VCVFGVCVQDIPKLSALLQDHDRGVVKHSCFALHKIAEFALPEDSSEDSSTNDLSPHMAQLLERLWSLIDKYAHVVCQLPHGGFSFLCRCDACVLWCFLVFALPSHYLLVVFLLIMCRFFPGN